MSPAPSSSSVPTSSGSILPSIHDDDVDFDYIDDDKIDDRKHHLPDDMAHFLPSICHLAMMMTLIMVLMMMIK